MPSPGEYKNVLGTNSIGKYPVSNVKNATNIVFGASKDKRFNYKCNQFYLFFIFAVFVLAYFECLFNCFAFKIYYILFLIYVSLLFLAQIRNNIYYRNELC